MTDLCMTISAAFLTVSSSRQMSVLIPLVDMANHAHKAYVIGHSPDDFTLFASGNLSQGDEVMISYGKHICNNEVS